MQQQQLQPVNFPLQHADREYILQKDQELLKQQQKQINMRVRQLHVDVDGDLREEPKDKVERLRQEVERLNLTETLTFVENVSTDLAKTVRARPAWSSDYQELYANSVLRDLQPKTLLRVQTRPNLLQQLDHTGTFVQRPSPGLGEHASVHLHDPILRLAQFEQKWEAFKVSVMSVMEAQEAQYGILSLNQAIATEAMAALQRQPNGFSATEPESNFQRLSL